MKIKQHIFNILMPVVRLYWRIFKPQTFGVKVLIKHPTKNNEVLLVLHSYGNKTLWNIPGGGYNPKKESAIEAAEREVKEELGVDIFDLVQVGEYKTSGEGKQDTVAMFVGVIDSSNDLKPNAEVAEIIWQSYQITLKRDDVARVARRTIEKAYFNN